MPPLFVQTQATISSPPALSAQHLQKILRAEQKGGAGHSSKALLSMLLVADSRPWELLSAGKTPKWHCLRRCVVCQGGWAALGQRSGLHVLPGCLACLCGRSSAGPAPCDACHTCKPGLLVVPQPPVLPSCTHPPLQRA